MHVHERIQPRYETPTERSVVKITVEEPATVRAGFPGWVSDH
jgi:hypothetical protein